MQIFYKPIYPVRSLEYSPAFKNNYDKANGFAVVGQGFGQNLNPTYAQMGLKGHNGIDIPCAEGTPVFAAHAGRVVKLSEKPSFGLGVTLQSEDGQFVTIYWHLKQILVTVGQQLRELDMVGLADSTGNSTGNHLHFGKYPIGEPKNNGYDGAVDPLPDIIESPNFSFDKNLCIGMKGEEVRNLQIALAYEGFLGQVGFYRFTGYFGSQTFEAVRMFQQKYGILSTGFCGPVTRAKLNEIYRKVA